MAEPNWVVRAGIAQVVDLQKGFREHLGVPGLFGLSVQYSPGVSIHQLAAAGRFRNRRISYAIAADLIAAAQSAGYGIEFVRSPGNPYHATLRAWEIATGLTLEVLPDRLAMILSTDFAQMLNPAPLP